MRMTHLKINPHPVHSSPIEIISTAIVQHQHIAPRKILLSTSYKVCKIINTDIHPITLQYTMLNRKVRYYLTLR